MAKPKERLDERLVREGLAPTRSQAQALILAGRVLVDDAPADKAGRAVPLSATVRLRGATRRYVSRGGDKLAGALADLGVEPAGKVCLDLGASTGGHRRGSDPAELKAPPIDSIRPHGAKQVVAVDVGYGQLDVRLRDDPRVRLLERTNARQLAAADVPEPIELVTIDVSFISATLLLPRVFELAPRAELLVMVKPQFEVGRERVGKGGVVRDDADRAAAVARVREAAEALGYGARGEVESRLAGPKGNREVFLWMGPRG